MGKENDIRDVGETPQSGIDTVQEDEENNIETQAYGLNFNVAQLDKETGNETSDDLVIKTPPLNDRLKVPGAMNSQDLNKGEFVFI